jgi:hypothetical protein
LRRLPSFWESQGATMLVACFVSAVVAGGVMLALDLFGGGDTLVQQGKAVVIKNQALEVYYPIPYVSPPHLSLSGFFPGSCALVEQKPDHFKIENMGNLYSVEVEWRAEGIRDRSR